ncbi:hypothetical protein B0H16DRAFT_1882695 [Mycena metata]|uniref:Uncharacterized protein n=1 Tax=Mycena metata TaxID=1033252 RepID=A0AAD7JK84_9AGAR|nr:hypothetical protein B0H16DRAFT_1882695 [Mycena metata]
MNFSPFDLPELVEYCIDFLHDSRPDLAACSLVSRPWVYPAQFHIFSATSWECMVDQHQQISRLSEISALPHILALISRLELNVYYLGQCDLSGAISRLTQLRGVRISGNLNSVPSTSQKALGAIRALIALPTVERVELYCSFETRPAATFIQIWDGCSEKIRHLSLGNIRVKESEYDWASSVVLKSRRKLALDSLYISYGNYVTPWLASDACPFDFSHLTTLSLTLKRLKVWLCNWQPPMIQDILDLGPFQQLQHLTIIALDRRGIPLQMAITALSTLPTDNRLASLEIECIPQHSMFLRLDELLFSMPLSELQNVKIYAKPSWPWTLVEKYNYEMLPLDSSLMREIWTKITASGFLPDILEVSLVYRAGISSMA